MQPTIDGKFYMGKPIIQIRKRNGNEMIFPSATTATIVQNEIKEAVGLSVRIGANKVDAERIHDQRPGTHRDPPNSSSQFANGKCRHMLAYEPFPIPKLRKQLGAMQAFEGKQR